MKMIITTILGECFFESTMTRRCASRVHLIWGNNLLQMTNLPSIKDKGSSLFIIRATWVLFHLKNSCGHVLCGTLQVRVATISSAYSSFKIPNHLVVVDQMKVQHFLPSVWLGLPVRPSHKPGMRGSPWRCCWVSAPDCCSPTSPGTWTLSWLQQR